MTLINTLLNNIGEKMSPEKRLKILYRIEKEQIEMRNRRPSRGVKKSGVTTITSKVLSRFREDPTIRKEFMSLIRS